jgi:hypothetical protein
VVVNMDLPWSPAVLEQRIGRVHRMGQSRGVQVVNFVGQGSIEEGMLSVLAFKKSLFEGVLDGGEHEVFLQGTRLSQFMKSVEQVAGAMGEAGLAVEPLAEAPTPVAESPSALVESADPWAAILEAGAALLQGLATSRGADGVASGRPPLTIERDHVTGQASIRLPLPDRAAKVSQGLRALVAPVKASLMC